MVESGDLLSTVITVAASALSSGYSVWKALEKRWKDSESKIATLEMEITLIKALKVDQEKAINIAIDSIKDDVKSVVRKYEELVKEQPEQIRAVIRSELAIFILNFQNNKNVGGGGEGLFED